MVDRDALIGVVASGYATLSCGQFQDNTYMECLVGEEDGSLSHYLDVLDGDDAEPLGDERELERDRLLRAGSRPGADDEQMVRDHSGA